MSLTFLALLQCIAGCDPASHVVGATSGSVALASFAVDNESPTGASFSEKLQGRRRPPALPNLLPDFPYPERTGDQIVVRRGDNLQRAIDKAKRGDEIVLAAGETFYGNFKLPAKPGSPADGWIVIRSEESDKLPPIGTRIGPQHAGLMSTVMTTNQSPAIATAPGASGWRLVGFEITAMPSMTDLNFALVSLGGTGSAQNTLEQVPTDLVIDRMYVHGQTTTNSMRCIALNSARTAITDSYIAECHAKGLDSQAIIGWNGPGQYKIVNNMLAGAGENIMFGGGDPSIPGLVPSDIEIRGNYIYKPISWKGVWTVKNLLETKNAARVLIEGNVLDGSWADAQGGAAILLRSTNQDGGCRWCRTTDLTLRRNLIRNSGGGIVFVGSDNADTSLRRILVTENVFDDLNTAPYVGAHSLAFTFAQGGQDITIERTVAVGGLYFSIRFDRDAPVTSLVFRDLVLDRGQHGMGADGTTEGTAGLQVGAPGYVWSNVTLIGASRGAYPPGTRFAASEASAPNAKSIRDAVAKATAAVLPP